MSRLDPATEERLVELLALIYARIDWRKIRTSRSAHDLWNHRLRAASTRETLGEFVSRLCNYFGLQSMPERAMISLEALRPYERELLDLIYREHVPIAVRAAMRAAEIKAQRRGNVAQLGLLDQRPPDTSELPTTELEQKGDER